MKKDIIVVDIETTSLNRLFAQIVSLGAVHLDSGDELDIHCCRDSKAIQYFDDFTTKIHGVTRDEWFARPQTSSFYTPQKQTVVEFIDFCLKHSSNPILAGKNLAGFDLMILHRTYDNTFDMTWELGHRSLDIGSLAYAISGQLLSSGDLAKFLKVIPESEIHSGISGARHEADILKSIFEKLKK